MGASAGSTDAAAERLVTAPPLESAGPQSLIRSIPPQEPRFAMVAEPQKRRAPQRVMSEPSVSGGRLMLRQAAVSTLQRKAPAEAAASSESPKGKKKGKKAAASMSPVPTSPSAISSSGFSQ